MAKETTLNEIGKMLDHVVEHMEPLDVVEHVGSGLVPRAVSLAGHALERISAIEKSASRSSPCSNPQAPQSLTFCSAEGTAPP